MSHQDETVPRQRRHRVIYAGCVNPLPIEDLEHILIHTRPLWDEARGQRIFLSGGTGFFGAWLLESLAHCNRRLNLGLSATVLSRDAKAFANRMPHLGCEPCIQLLQGDVCSFEFPKLEFEYVIHAAAPTSSALKPLELLATMIDGTARVLSFAQARGVNRFLFTSSGAVYGSQPNDLTHIPEEYRGGPDWLNPQSAYAEGKRVSELMCSAYAQESDIQFAIARCFAFVGPHLPLDQHFAIGNFIGDALAGRTVRIRGDGTPLRSYLYSADLAIWLWTLLFKGMQPATNPNVFNVGSGEAVSIRDLAQLVVDELNPSLKIEVARPPIAGAPRLQYVPDVQNAGSRLDLRQIIGLREAIRRTAAWHR